MNKILILTYFIHYVFSTYSQNTDINLLRDINLNRNKNLDKTFIFITNSHTIVPITIMSSMAMYSIIKKDSIEKTNIIILGASLITTGIVTHSLKRLINRKRPCKTYPEIEKLSNGASPSFPSGHTSEAFAFATSLSLSHPKYYVVVPSFAWACAVAYSRMDLGVHYPSDVLAGALIGTGSAFLCRWFNKKIIEKRKKYVKNVD